MMNQQPMPTEQTQQKLTIEQEEERKLRSKYPNPQKPGGSAFIQKMLHKGSKKYFDSGDYNMAKSKKQGLLNGLNKGGNIPPLADKQTSSIGATNASTPVSQVRADSDQAMSTSDLSSPCTTNISSITLNEPCMNNLTPEKTLNSSSNNQSMNTSDLPKPCTPNQKQMMNNQFENVNNTSGLLNTSSNANATSPLSSSLSSTNLQNANANNYYTNQMVLSTSQSSQGISLLSSSMSSDKIAQIQINPQQSLVLDSEEIGHGIPTPECLPQSRKHSIVQSKLATPRLSSS